MKFSFKLVNIDFKEKCPSITYGVNNYFRQITQNRNISVKGSNIFFNSVTTYIHSLIHQIFIECLL